MFAVWTITVAFLVRKHFLVGIWDPALGTASAASRSLPYRLFEVSGSVPKLSSFLSSPTPQNLFPLTSANITLWLGQPFSKDQGNPGNCRTSPFHLLLDHIVSPALIPADPSISVTSPSKPKPWCHPSVSLLNTPTLQSPDQCLTSRKASLILQLADWILPSFALDSSCMHLCLISPIRLSALKRQAPG